jgi:chromosomal replication initiation ATPase DnaA
VLPELERLLSPHAYATWFRPTYGWRFDAGGALVVAVPVKAAEEWIPNAFGSRIDEALKAAGLPARPVRFECSNAPARASPPLSREWARADKAALRARA